MSKVANPNDKHLSRARRFYHYLSILQPTFADRFANAMAMDRRAVTALRGEVFP